MYCVKCGAQNVNEARYCAKCGRMLNREQSYQSTSQTKESYCAPSSAKKEKKKVSWYNTPAGGITLTLLTMLLAIALFQTGIASIAILALALWQGFRVIAMYMKK